MQGLMCSYQTNLTIVYFFVENMSVMTWIRYQIHHRDVYKI